MAAVMDDMRFDEQVAVITGAGRVLGKQYALLLAARGARVVVNDLGGSVTGLGADKDTAHTTAREINDQGGEESPTRIALRRQKAARRSSTPRLTLGAGSTYSSTMRGSLATRFSTT
jgi:NAD(P)-dependent dehydrogenase (short-subunit alcohol dehydrogenase family)